MAASSSCLLTVFEGPRVFVWHQVGCREVLFGWSLPHPALHAEPVLLGDSAAPAISVLSGGLASPDGAVCGSLKALEMVRAPSHLAAALALCPGHAQLAGAHGLAPLSLLCGNSATGEGTRSPSPAPPRLGGAEGG